MIPLGILASSIRLGSSGDQPDRLIFPLTFDEFDATNSVALTRSGGYGPHVTPDGFEGDGCSARYSLEDLPPWLSSSSTLTLAATVQAPMTFLSSTKETLVSLMSNSTTPKIELVKASDPQSAYTGAMAVQSGASQQIIGRPGWKYEFRSPILRDGSNVAKPQGLLFLDDDTIVFSLHLDDTESRVYKMSLSSGEVLGEFTFGTVTHRHVASFAMRDNGDVWVGDYDSLSALKIDLEQSFSTGIAQVEHVYDCSQLPGFSAITFATISGVEYLVSGQYSTTETNAYLRLIDASKLENSAFVAGDDYRYYRVGRRIQGLAMRDGMLLLCRNSLYGMSGAVNGYIQEFDIMGIVANLPSDSIIRGNRNSEYLTGEWFAPSSYPEDLAVHPTTGDVFTSTEGAYSVADYDGYLALWSSPLTYAGVKNDYVLEYDGAGTLLVKINGHEWGTLPWELPTTASSLTIGGPESASEGMTSGFTWCHIANVLIQDRPLSEADANTLFSGGFEAETLVSYELVITNPGAETGDTSGWDVEEGGMTVRTQNPLPLEGGFYFTGGSHVRSLSRQRLNLDAQSVPTLDPSSWAKVRWMQSAYSDQDPGGMGIRQLTPVDQEIDLKYPLLAWVPGGGGSGGPWYWYPRSLPVTLDPSTRKVDVLYNASGRTEGTANDFYVDSVRMTIYQA